VALLVVVGQAAYPDLARAFIRTIPSILEFLDEHEPPFIAKVYRPSPGELERRPAAAGRIELWYPNPRRLPPRRA
jgi:hypothetical protein